jgi:hypothetical protein
MDWPGRSCQATTNVFMKFIEEVLMRMTDAELTALDEEDALQRKNELEEKKERISRTLEMLEEAGILDRLIKLESCTKN